MVKKRFSEIDLLRGLAVIGMFIFHTYFVMDYYGAIEVDMYKGGFGVIARFVQFVFIGLVGATLAISRQKHVKMKYRGFVLHHWRRGLFVLVLAMVISLVTKFFAGDEFVKFGILHLIAVSIFVGSFLARFRFLNLVLGIGAIWLGYVVSDVFVECKLLYVIGFDVDSIAALDYFPIFPWIGVAFIGTFFGNVFYRKYKQIVKLPAFDEIRILKGITFLGKNTLFIYMVHIPIILAWLVIIGVIPLEAVIG